jgi:uncharacterized protein YciI
LRYLALTLEPGPAWDASRPMREQAAWREHAELMDRWVDEGFIVLGGPFGREETILVILDAETEEEVRARFASDPWIELGIRRVAEIVPWQILLRAGE